MLCGPGRLVPAINQCDGSMNKGGYSSEHATDTSSSRLSFSAKSEPMALRSLTDHTATSLLAASQIVVNILE